LKKEYSSSKEIIAKSKTILGEYRLQSTIIHIITYVQILVRLVSIE